MGLKAKFVPSVTATLLVVLHTCAMTPAFAEPRGAPRVSVGETASPNNRRDTARALRNALVEQLSSMDDLELTQPTRARYVVRGAVTRMEHRREATENSVHCDVSLIVAESRNGAVRMMLRGSADARGGDHARLEGAALEAAVRGAVRPLAESLSRLR